VVLDPFAGSGVIPFEALLAGRVAWAGDLNPYAAAVTLGKLQAPPTREAALARVDALGEALAGQVAPLDEESVPAWVRDAYHPDTLRELLAALDLLSGSDDYFLLAALLGIAHGTGARDLSYPTGRYTADVQRDKVPPADHPDRYAYRPLLDHLRAHVAALYHRPLLPAEWEDRRCQVWVTSALSLPLDDASVDAVISGPPTIGTLDTLRPHALRLALLGYDDLAALAGSLIASRRVYFAQMTLALKEMFRVLKPGSDCVLVTRDVEREGRHRRTAEILADLAEDATGGGFIVRAIHDDRDLAARKANGHGIHYTRILVLNKRA